MGIWTSIIANLALGVVLLAAFALHRTRENVRLRSPEEALAILRSQLPDLEGPVTLSEDGTAALVALGQGSGIGLVHRHGRRWNARELQPEDLRKVTTQDTTIQLALADFGWPRTAVRICDAGTREAWLARLQAFAAGRPNSSTGMPHA